jgi:hypothetical protein
VHKEYITPAELVERYQGRITTRTLANWRSLGVSPPYTKIGGRILYRLADILEWEKKRTVTGTHQYVKELALFSLVSNLITMV